MSVIKIENLYKEYRLGSINHRTLREDLITWWSRIIGKNDPNSIIGFNNIKNIDRILALKNINLEIKQGERLGIIGKNGAGKSTLLKILSKITSPTSGLVKIRGRVASLLEVGTGFHPELTGRENIYLNGSIYGMKKKEIDIKINEIIDFSGISKYIETPVKRYSSGMHVRLGFAIAAHLEPEILMVDEILAVGDADFQKKCLGKLKNLRQTSRTVIFVSHNMSAIETLCEKVIVIHEGKIDYYGKPKDAINFYLSNSLDKPQCEIVYDQKETAPGDDRLKLKAVRILSEGMVTSNPSCSKDIEIQIEYWNQTPGKRWVGFWLLNSIGYPICTPSNNSESTIKPDPWYGKVYPVGLFQTCCIIPGNLLNHGEHSINLQINGQSSYDSIVSKDNILKFNVIEDSENKGSKFYKTVGIIRPKFDWNTKNIINE